MPSIENQQPSQSVVQFFNMFGNSQANATSSSSPTVTKTPNRSTHTRKNSKQLQARASSLSPKPNRQNKLPKINNNNNSKHNTTPNHKFNAKHDNHRNNHAGSNSGRTPQRNSTHRGSCSNSRDTGKQQQQQHKATINNTSNKHTKNNCPQNENNHSDSSLSVKSSKSSFVKLATLTNKSDPDSDNGGSTNNHPHRYNTRARYQRNSESSFHFENQANSELFAGSSSAPDAKSLPLPPTAWLGAIGGKPSGNNLNNVPKNHLKNLKNNAPQLTESNLNPTVQNLFASMALVSTSA
jgi:hypothetical protein